MSDAEDRGDRSSITHIAGLPVQIGSMLRQRCGWCGVVLIDMDLALVMVQDKPDGSPGDPPGHWPIGGLIEVDKGRGFKGGIHIPETGPVGEFEIPANCCARLPGELTAGTAFGE